MEGRTDWVLALPLKGLAEAKSRITLPEAARAELALAMALDTAAAVRECPLVAAVWVVCDRDTAPAFASDGYRVLVDPGVGGLNGALTAARDRVRAEDPTVPFASLVADLPALRPADLAGALEGAVAHRRSFVADAAGTGTTLLAARRVAAYRPAYGPASADRHRRLGAVELRVPAGSPLRADVDTLADLLDGAGPALGRRTGRLLVATSV